MIQIWKRNFRLEIFTEITVISLLFEIPTPVIGSNETEIKTEGHYKKKKKKGKLFFFPL